MSNKYALIIGNTEYSDAGLAQLNAPGKDAEDFVRVLKSPEIAAFDDVVAFVNEIASNLREAIEEFFAGKKPDDMLVFYFSGHGVRDEAGSLYLAVKNTNRSKLRSTAVEADFISRSMDRSRSKRQVIILDCCNSGAFAHGTKAETGGAMGIAKTFQGTGYGRVVLTATDATQFAWEGDKIIGDETTNSLFTHFLVKGLEGEADRDGDGKITVDNLYDYVHEQIVLLTPKQTPGKWSFKQQGELILRQAKVEDIKPLPLPADLLDEVDDTRPYVREAAVQKLEKILKGKNIGQAHSAREALEKIIADENTTRRVAQVATQALKSVQPANAEKTEDAQRNSKNVKNETADSSKTGELRREYQEEVRRILAAQNTEEERLAKKKDEAERKSAEKDEEEKYNAENARKAEAERLAAQKAEEERLAKEKAEAERLVQEKTETKEIAPTPPLPLGEGQGEGKAKSRDKIPTYAALGGIAFTLLFGGIYIFNRPAAPENKVTVTSQVTVTLAPTTPPLGIGSTQTSEKDGATLVYVPAGEFTMGSDDGDSDEQPIHKVTLDFFWIDQTEVTNKQYATCVSAGGCAAPSETKSDTRASYYGDSQFDSYPVIYVDWNRAKTYCEWAGRRLPIEAEWEKAARGTDGRKYPWGEDISCDKANYHDGSKYCVGDTTAVKSYESGKSIYGAYDMAGNVLEWVSSLYKTYPYNINDGREDMTSSDRRALRGGSWGNGDLIVRSAYRGYNAPAVTYNNAGFRCARSLLP